MNTTSERDLSIETMGEHLYGRMVALAENSDCCDDVGAIYDEWIVDGVDPDDGMAFIFMENFTLKDWTWNFAESDNV